MSDIASAEAYQTQFDGFLSNLALDATRVGRIEGALAHLRSFVASDSLLTRRRPTVFVQGSYGQRHIRDEDPFALRLRVSASSSRARRTPAVGKKP